jgi:hypothetical protein
VRESSRAVDADELQVVEQRLVVAELFPDVLLEVGREGRRQRVGVRQLSRTLERRLGQRHGRSDDRVLLKQVLRPELGEPRVLDERVVRGCERADREGDLPPEAGARRIGRAQ